MENRQSQQASEELIRIREEKCRVLHEIRTTVRDCMNVNKGVFRLTQSDHNGYAQFYSFGAQLVSGAEKYELRTTFVIRDVLYAEHIYLSDSFNLYRKDIKAYKLSIEAGPSVDQRLESLRDTKEDTTLLTDRFFSRFVHAGVIPDPKNGNMEYSDTCAGTNIESETFLDIIQGAYIEKLPNAPLVTYRQFLREVGDPFDHGQIRRSMKPFN